MEVEKSQDRKLLVVFYEMMGTALFMYCILVSRANPLGVIVGLFASIILFGSVTGGHFNPAVTLGVYLSNGKHLRHLLWLIMILLGQFIGAILGLGFATLSMYEKDEENMIPAESRLPKLCP